MPSRLQRFFRRPDFRAHPLRAVARRIGWRLRWGVSRRPWRVPTAAGFSLWIPKSGSGALIYYQGLSEPETARFLARVLQPGMIFVDVGAHFGEYTVMAARWVGAQGWVHAFEPQPETFALLEKNVAANALRNVVLNACAVADCEGEAVFWERAEPASSSLAGGRPPDASVRRVYRVPVRTLDAYCQERDLIPHVIKADVEGAERLVVLGARELCSLSPERAPLWLLEHSASACARFGDRLERLAQTLAGFGYSCFTLKPDGEPEPMTGPPAPDAPTHNLIAWKRRPA